MHENPALLQSLIEADELPPAFDGFGRALRRFDFRDIILTPPTTLIDDDTTIELGDSEVQLLYVGPAHTAGDIVVYLPGDRVLFTGDILFNECTPIGWEGTFTNWIAALERLATLEPAVVVPGHGPLGDAEDLLALRDYLAYVYDEARAHFEAGHTTLQAAKAIDLGPWLDWEEPERLAFQINRAYRELAGEAWDTPVDIGKVFSEVGALRAHFQSTP